MSAKTSIPQIRFCQFESESLGAFEKSVNLFRGDVNDTRELFSMPGRSGRPSPSASVAMRYESNVRDQVMTRNLSAPTGVLGLGWTLPLEKVTLVSGGALSQGSRRYVLQARGASGPLALDRVEGGKEYYQLRDHQPWIICYDPAHEAWEITTEKGITHVYGGGVQATPQGHQESRGNSIAWGVRYGNWIGATRFTHAENATAAPAQYAREWYLSESRNAWGDVVAYEYNGFSRTSEGLLGGVERFVGDAAHGKPYTTAVYLTRITDTFGRTARFSYQDKTYDDSTPGAPKEYEAAHSATPNVAGPTGHQDRYETRYLDSIAVADAAGATLRTLHFDYHPLSNLTSEDSSSELYGATYKRYLKAVDSTTPAGESLPGLAFTYYTDTSATGAHLGALESVTIAEGAVGIYTYERRELDICDRQLEITKPARDVIGTDTPRPRVWFGKDFAVVTWCNIDTGKLWLGIYSWLGRWQAWSPASPVIYEGIAADSLEVFVSEQSVAVACKDASHTYLQLYGQDPARAGEWISHEADGITGLTFASTRMTFHAGTSFLVACREDAVDNHVYLSRMHWSWKTRQWSAEIDASTVSGKRLFVTSGADYYLTMVYDHQARTNTLALCYLGLDANNDIAWQSGGQTVLTGVRTADHAGTQYLAGGASSAAVVTPSRNSHSRTHYDLHALRWDEGYQFQTPFKASCSMRKNSAGQLPSSIAPEVVADTLISSGDTLWRWNGSAWLQNEHLQPSATPPSRDHTWFAYGDDLAVKVVNKGTRSPEIQVLAYDAESTGEISSWATTPHTPAVTAVHGAHRDEAYFPTARGGDYFTCGNDVFYRGTSTDWVSPAASPIFTIPDTIDTRTLVNQAPSFLAYLVPDHVTPSNTSTKVLELENGRVKGGAATVLAGQALSLDQAPGKAPAGPNAFVTFPATTRSGDLDNATSVTLHRYAGDAIEGKLVHYAVSRLTVSNGFGEDSSSAYDFDASSAACDPSGRVVQYYQSTVYPGSATRDGSRHGSIVNRFVNSHDGQSLEYGLNGQTTTGQVAYPALDGHKLSEETRDHQGHTVARVDHVWDVFTLRNRQPATKDTTPEQLFGAYVRPRSRQTTRDGVSSSTTFGYIPAGFDAPFSGLPVEQCETNHDGQGEAKLLTTTHTYGYEKYPDLAGQNRLDAVVQTVHTVTSPGSEGATGSEQASSQPSTPITIRAEAQTWKDWGGGQWERFRSYKWQGGAGSDQFPFATASTGDPSGWSREHEITSRDARGLAVTTAEHGLVDSLLRDRAGEYVVARFHNADLGRGEADYYGFEAIETGTGWTLNEHAAVVSGRCYTGLRSLRLHQNGTLSKPFTPGTKQVYVLGYWYKTAAGYSATAGSGQTLTVTGGTTHVAPVSRPFADTGGAWVFEQVAIDLRACDAGEPITLTVESRNTSAEAVWIDNLRLLPDVSGFTAYVYDASRDLTLCKLGNGGHLERNLHDRFDQSLGAVGPYEEQLSGWQIPFHSRQAHAAFSASEPNHLVRIHALDGGSSETFLDPDGWQDRWQASNAGHWTAGDGRLRHGASTVADTLQPKHVTAGEQFFLGFGLESLDGATPLALTDTVGLHVGSETHFTFDPTAGTWSLAVAGEAVAAQSTPGATPLDWGLLVKDKTVILFVDGRVVVSTVAASSVTGTPSLSVGKNAVALRHLALIRRPKVEASFQDAMGQGRQEQTLTNNNAIVSQTVVDALGQTIVETKKAPAFFATFGATTPLLVYRSGFVDVPALHAGLDGTGVLTGDLAHYYDGSHGASDDGGYPYKRSLLERSPHGRVIEKGEPGRAHAIINPSTTTPASRHTLKFNYTNNSAETVAGAEHLPSGEYFVRKRTSPSGVISWRLTEKAGGKVLKAMDQGPGTTTNLLNHRLVEYTDTGRVERQRLPNYFDTTLAGHTSFEIVRHYDRLGNEVSATTPDAGTSRSIHDSAGHLRFHQDALGAAAGYYAYVRYDAIHRVIEKGILTGAWDAATLQAHADQPAYPHGLAGQTVQKQLSYVRRSQSAHGIGLLSTVTVHAEDDSGTVVTEQYRYDRFSRVTAVTTTTTRGGSTLEQNTVGYGYTATGKVAQVVYPQAAGASPGTVHHGYDDLDRMTGVGTAADATHYAGYAYGPDGKLTSHSLGTDGPSFDFSFHPPGWEASMASSDAAHSFSESLPSYTAGGLIHTVSDHLACDGTTEASNLSADYDSTGALSSVTYGSSQSAWDLAATYDANGNFHSVTQGAETETYHYTAGTNQVTGVQRGDTPRLTLGYDAKGGVSRVTPSAIASGDQLGFTYMKSGFLPSRVTIGTGGDRLDLYYGAKGRRALKQLTRGGRITGSKHYVHGLHTQPLLELTDAGATAYIYGAHGLIAFRRGGELYSVVRDHSGSSRMVYDASGTAVAAWSYSAFGEQHTVHEATPNLLAYRYGGQEWDEEIGLYNFHARLYDPRLRRFYNTDPKHQYAGAYIFIGNDPLSLVDPTGMWSLWGWVKEAVEAVTCVAEIAAGVAIDVASGGTLSMIGGAFIGAGIGGATAMINANLHGQTLSWAKFGENEAVGAVTGAITEGFGAVGDALGDAAANAVEGTVADAASSTAEDVGGELGEGAVKAGQGLKATAAKGAVKIGVGTAGGATSGVAGKMVKNVCENKSIGSGLGKAAIGGAAGGLMKGLGDEVGGPAWKRIKAGGKRALAYAERKLLKKPISDLVEEEPASLTKQVFTEAGEGFVKGAFGGAGDVGAWAMGGFHHFDWQKFAADTVMGGAKGGVKGGEKPLRDHFGNWDDSNPRGIDYASR